MILLGHSNAITDITFSPDEREITSTSKDTTVRIWDKNAALAIATTKVHEVEVTALAISPRGDSVVTACSGGDHWLKIWDRDLREVKHILRDGGAGITAAEFSHDGRWLATSSNQRLVALWDATNWSVARIFKSKTGGFFQVAFNPSDQLLAAPADDGSILIWAPSGEKPVQTLWCGSWTPLRLAWQDEDTLISAHIDGTVIQWRVSTATQIRRFHPHSTAVGALAIRPDGRKFASGGRDKIIQLWDIPAGKPDFTMKDQPDWINALAYAPKGRLIASGGADAAIRVWNGESGRLLAILPGHREPISDLAFTSDCKRLYSASADRTVRIWDVSTFVAD